MLSDLSLFFFLFIFSLQNNECKLDFLQRKINLNDFRLKWSINLAPMHQPQLMQLIYFNDVIYIIIWKIERKIQNGGKSIIIYIILWSIPNWIELGSFNAAKTKKPNKIACFGLICVTWKIVSRVYYDDKIGVRRQ